MNAETYIQQMIVRARAAQSIFEGFTQLQVDQAVRAIGKAVYDHAEELSRLAVDETGMGIYEDKILKNKNKSKACWNKLKGQKSRGIIRHIESEGLVEIAKPMGVVGSICPTTNPTMTPMQNAMIALKGGNSIICSPHPRAKKSSMLTCNIMRNALEDIGAPADLIQCVEEPTIEKSGFVMSLCDVCISTGGPGMVTAAYHSGKPAFGVGPGNVQALVDREIDLSRAVAAIVQGRTYDAGILCTCEQSIIYPAEQHDAVLAAMANEKVCYIDDDSQIQSIRNTIFPDGKINAEMVGKSAFYIASCAGIPIPEETRALLILAQGTGTDDILSGEKLCPVLSAYPYHTWEEAVDIAKANILNMGIGHSVVIHSQHNSRIEYAALQLPVSRFAVNQQGSSALGGAFTNGLNPTGTLGCGSWGNNSISENLWYHHLINVTRIAHTITDRVIPTDDQIWNT